MSKEINVQEALEVEALWNQGAMLPNQEATGAAAVMDGAAANPIRMPGAMPVLPRVRPTQAFMVTANEARKELEDVQEKGEQAAAAELGKLSKKGQSLKKGDKIHFVQVTDKDFRLLDVEVLSTKKVAKTKVKKKKMAKKAAPKKAIKKVVAKTKKKTVAKAATRKKPGRKPALKAAGRPKAKKARKTLKAKPKRALRATRQAKRGPGRPRKTGKI